MRISDISVYSIVGNIATLGGSMIEEIIDKYIRFMQKHYETQTAAASDLNISRAHLNKIIHKHDNPSLTLLKRMEDKMKECHFEE